MLTLDESLGLFGLSVSAATALLVTADLAITAGELGKLRQRIVGRTFIGHSEGSLGAHLVEQRVCRLDTKERTLGFRDRSYTSHPLRGTIRVGGESLELIPRPDAELWTSEDERANAAQLDARSFEALYEQAKTARGTLRTVRTEVKPRALVFIVGEKTSQGLEAELVSTFPPLSFIKSRRLAICAVVALNFAWAALGFWLALSRPSFGTWSIAGALLLLFHLIGITPLAVKVRLNCRTPGAAYLRGTQRDPARRLTNEGEKQGAGSADATAH